MEPLKNLFSSQWLQLVANGFEEVLGMRPADFLAAVLTTAWDDLELNERVNHIARVLHAAFGRPFDQAQPDFMALADWLKGQPVQGYPLMFMPAYVQQFGLADPVLALDTIEQLTQLISCEFAVRPLLRDQPEMVLGRMCQWAVHSNHHVRRLASEGCRPRLPWGLAMQALIKDPTPIIPVLTTLRQDPSLYVRKSVANNLNDITKTHPELVLQWCHQYISQHPDTDWIINHALRSLLKAGHPEALALLGWQPAQHVAAKIEGDIQTRLGQRGKFIATIEVIQPIPKARLEYRVTYHRPSKSHHKVFMISKTTLASGTHTYHIKLDFVDLSTRKHHAGPHQISLILNGVVHAVFAFEVMTPNEG